MRYPRRIALFGLLTLAGGLAALAIVPGLISSGSSGPIALALGAGVVLILLSGAMLARAIIVGRGIAALDHARLIAHWHIDSLTWDSIRRQSPDPGRVKFRGRPLGLDRPAHEPVEVRVGPSAFMLDGRLYSLNRLYRPRFKGVVLSDAAGAGCLEWHFIYPSRRGGLPRPRAVVRMPVPLHARPQAEKVIGHFHPAVLSALKSQVERRRRIVLGIGAAFLGGGLVLAGAGIALDMIALFLWGVLAAAAALVYLLMAAPLTA